MLTKDDLMKLDKERLCELLIEAWKEISQKDVFVPCNHPIIQTPLGCKDDVSECGIGLTTQGSNWVTTHDEI